MNINSLNSFLNIVAFLSGLVTIIKFFMDLYSSHHQNISENIFPSVRINAIVKQINAPQIIYVQDSHSSYHKDDKTAKNTIDNIIIIVCIILLPFGMFWFQQYKNSLYLFVAFTILSFSILQLYRIKKHYYTEITFFSLLIYLFSAAIVLFIGYFNLFAPENYEKYLLEAQSFTTLNVSTLLHFLTYKVMQKPSYFLYFLFQFASLLLLMTDYIKNSIDLFYSVIFHKQYVPLKNKNLRITILTIFILGMFFYVLLYLIQLVYK